METTNFLKSFFTEHWKYLAVNAACKLNLFDSIGTEMLSATELAALLKVHEKYLTMLLQALHQIGFLHQNAGKYALNEVSQHLTETHQQSLKYACLNWSGEHLQAWQNLDYSITTGKSAFENQYQQNYFDYLNQFPAKLHNYQKAMFEYAQADYKHLHELIDFGIHTSVMDVGGGYGAAIHFIKKQFPAMNCVLFDLASVIEKANLEEIKGIKGDFFVEIPPIADAIILSRVLHDWHDEKALIILENCFKALPKGGYLYIIENCSDKINIDLSLLSLNMLVMCESFERSSDAYIALADKAGFIHKQITHLNTLQSILTFIKP